MHWHSSTAASAPASLRKFAVLSRYAFTCAPCWRGASTLSMLRLFARRYTRVLLLLAEHFRGKRPKRRPVAPRRGRQAGLHTRLVEERLPIPPPLDGNLGEQQAPHPPLRDHQSVLADLDLFGPDGEQGGEDGDLDAQGGKFLRGNGGKARILGGRGHRTFLDHLEERRHRLGVTDAAAQPPVLREGDERGSGGGQRSLRPFHGRNLPRVEVPFQRRACDPEQALSLRSVQVRPGFRPGALRHELTTARFNRAAGGTRRESPPRIPPAGSRRRA